MERRGFAYIVVVMILGLLAFMGLFLIQSSSAEYSSASISVYRTMAKQLAEAAADEAFVMLDERFRDKTSTGYFGQLLWQAAGSTNPKGGGQTGLNPSLLKDFKNLNEQVLQCIALKDTFMTRAGFTIEKVMPTIKDLRPIPQGFLDDKEAYYRSPDRANRFDDEYSNDWYLTLNLEIRVSLNKNRKISLDYSESRDVKVLNLGPVARNYSFFNMMGPRINNDPARMQGELRDNINSPDIPGARLILWNQPFQSRVYMHGPAIVELENPELFRNPANMGAFNEGAANTSNPGSNQAFQYSDTFYGFSYYPTVARCIFPDKTLREIWFGSGRGGSKNDVGAMGTLYPEITDHATMMGGLLPHKDRGLWDMLGDVSNRGIQDTYVRGTNIHQKLLPAGLYCRTPWKFVSQTKYTTPGTITEDRYLPNSLADEQSGEAGASFPKDEEQMIIEHRWLKEDLDVEKNHRIRAQVFPIKYNNVTNSVRGREEKFIEFTLSYYNNPDPEGMWSKLGYTVSNTAKAVWTSLIMPFEAVAVIASPLVNKLFPGEDEVLSANLEKEYKNLFPTNFKYHLRSVATRRFASVDDIPKDKDGRWILRGVYWLDSFEVPMPVTYIGTGTIVIFQPVKPVKIMGSILAAKLSGQVMGHLNLMYMPKKSTSSDLTKHTMQLIGKGIVIHASVYSFYGISTDSSSNIADFSRYGIDHSKPTNAWGEFFPKMVGDTNVIYGNYVNGYMCKKYLKGDLWVVHNTASPLYFDTTSPQNYRIVQRRLDADAAKDIKNRAERHKYELMTHEYVMSPNIQHVAVMGNND